MATQTSSSKEGAGRLDQAARLKEIIAIFNRHELVRGLTPDKLLLILEDLGPTYIKLGQILSMRPDVIPRRYCEALTQLRSSVKPMEFAQVRQVVEDSLGLPLEEAFAEFDPTAMGSASIAQAHRARLHSGEAVVVKVQRQDVREVMARDISLMRRAAGLLKLAGSTGEVLDFNMILSEMWSVTQEELDFLAEAKNAEHFYALNSGVAYATCPRIFRQYTSSRVLVMECIDGVPIGQRQKLLDAGYDLPDIGAKLANNYLKQIIDDGFFHADPHQGNIIIRGGQIVWIDMGMMGRLTLRDQRLLGKAVAAIADHDVTGVKDVLLSLGHSRGRVNHVQLYSDVDDMLSRYGDIDMADIDLSAVLGELLDLCKAHDISMPAGFTMLVRGVATLEGVVAELAPEISVLTVAANLIGSGAVNDFDWKNELTRSAKTIWASGHKALELPGLLADLLRLTARGQSKVNVEVYGAAPLTTLLSDLINKLTIGLLIAGLLVASSLLCTTDMRPQLLNIPALGALGYLASLVLFIWLLRDMLRKPKE